MTAIEMHELSTRLEKAGVDPNLLWRPAEVCPQGHSNRDMECGGFLQVVGEVCFDCFDEGWGQPALDALFSSGTLREPMEAEWDTLFASAEAFREQLDTNPTFHADWRIGRVSVDWADANIVLRALEAWCDLVGALGEEVAFHREEVTQLWSGRLRLHFPKDTTLTFHGADLTWGESVALSLLNATAGSGGSKSMKAGSSIREKLKISRAPPRE